jgi:metal-responsive CopG/Arc/MetJ family transcriptional regulator
MKVAVSIPDDVFRDADAAARRRKWSRSRLYAEALRAYVTSDEKDQVTLRLNAVHDRPIEVDADLRRAQFATLTDESW